MLYHRLYILLDNKDMPVTVWFFATCCAYCPVTVWYHSFELSYFKNVVPELWKQYVQTHNLCGTLTHHRSAAVWFSLSLSLSLSRNAVRFPHPVSLHPALLLADDNSSSSIYPSAWQRPKVLPCQGFLDEVLSFLLNLCLSVLCTERDDVDMPCKLCRCASVAIVKNRADKLYSKLLNHSSCSSLQLWYSASRLCG